MTKQQWKKQFGAERKLARKLNGWKLWAQGKRLLEVIKAECGLNKVREDENSNLEKVARNDADDALMKAAGII